MVEEKQQLVPIKLKEENCPPFLLELLKMAEDSREEYPEEAGNDLIILGSEAIEKLGNSLYEVGVVFQLKFKGKPSFRVATVG